MTAAVTGLFEIPRQPVVQREFLGHNALSPPSLLDLPYKRLTNSGRSALLLALKACGVGPGDQVLVPTYHCPTMIAPIERLGASPVFYALSSGGDPDLTALADSDAVHARAMLAVHFFGRPCAIHHAAVFCAARGIRLIEDCAHCFTGTSVAGEIGRAGDFAIGSLAKVFPVRTGGLLGSTNALLSLGRLPARSPRREVIAIWDAIDMGSRSDRLGVLGRAIRLSRRTRTTRRGNLHLDVISDAPPRTSIRDTALEDPLIDPAPLPRFFSWLVAHSDLAAISAARTANFREIAAGLDDLSRAKPLFREPIPGTSPYVIPLLVDQPDKPYQRMRQLNLPVFRWDRVWPGTPKLPDDHGRLWSRGIIQIACHQSLRSRDIDHLIAEVRNTLR